MGDRHWPDWANLFLAGWLFITPWFYGFAAIPGAAWSAWVVAALVGAFALVALASRAAWPRLLVTLLGLWLAGSPWLVGGTGEPALLWNFVAIGALLIVFGAVALRTRRGPDAAA